MMLSGKAERVQGWRVFVKLDWADGKPLDTPWFVELPRDRCPDLEPGMVVALTYERPLAKNNA